MTAAPECLDCAFSGLGHPCRTGGRFDPGLVAEAYLLHGCFADDADPEADTHWSVGCLMKMVRDHPDLAFGVLVMALQRATTVKEVGMLAAGPLEQIIADHGPNMIDRIETLAQTSLRFRFALSGVWSQGQEGTDVWQRVLAARDGGPVIDRGDALPPPDLCRGQAD